MSCNNLKTNSLSAFLSTIMPMEIQFPSIPTIIIFVLFICMVVAKTRRRYNTKSSALNLPPGPWQLPLIGNMHQLVVSSLPHRTLRSMAEKHGPVVHLMLGQLSTVIVSSPEMAMQIMKTQDTNFAYRPPLYASRILLYNCTDIGFSPYGNYWRQLRKICTVELLSPKRVQTFRGIREEEVLNLIRSISSDARSNVNLSKKIFSLTYGITARASFGKKIEHQEAFIKLMEEMLHFLGRYSISDMYPSLKWLQVLTGSKPRLVKLHKRIDEILDIIVKEHRDRERRTSEAEDLVDVLLRMQKNGDFEVSLTDDNIKAVIFDIFAAGSETSSTAVEWAISEMLKNPESMRIAQAEVRDVYDKKGNVDETSLHELKYLKLVIKETLRLHPPAPLLLPRVSQEDCEINGYMIPRNTTVIVNAWAINRHAERWIEAEKFKPERFLDNGIDFQGCSFDYIPFGAGRRICPGIAFAIPDMELPLAQLLYHFDWELCDGLRHEELDMTEGFGFTIRRKTDLRLTPIPYSLSFI